MLPPPEYPGSQEFGLPKIRRPGRYTVSRRLARAWPEKNFELRRVTSMRFVQFVSQFHREESGQDLLEYALVLAAVLLAAVAGSSPLSGTISNALSTINTRIQSTVS